MRQVGIMKGADPDTKGQSLNKRSSTMAKELKNRDENPMYGALAGSGGMDVLEKIEANERKKPSRGTNARSVRGMKSGGKVRGSGCCKRTKKCKMR